MKRWFFLPVVLLLSSCYVFRAYKFRKFELTSLDKIDAVSLPPSPQPFLFAYDTVRYPQMVRYLDENLAASQSYAFLVIRRDTILYERYFGNITDTTVLPSFSVAKSVTSTLLAIALHEGYIKNLQDPVTTYLPQLRKKDRAWDSVTLQHVLDMRSGVKSNESYTNPFSDVLKLGFASNVSKHALQSKTEEPPGRFEYKSTNTQLLALIVEKATGRKLQDYAAEKLWAPLGMEHTTTWNSDKRQTVRAFCCINAVARDYAKLGRLFLKKGAWQGKQLVTEDWVGRSTNADTMLKYGGYKNQWWAGAQYKYFDDSVKAAQFVQTRGGGARFFVPQRPKGSDKYGVQYYTGAFHAEGLLGQYVYVHPAKDLVIVRLGYNWSHPNYYARQFIYKLGEDL